ncbi:LysM peptidoglycan-binding domain-containing protein [Microbacterium marinilacus]|uniref:LysM domain-containing protein n=1 Tax=Microbacterium marinilacus TaxID=415209 RepID=A0ABP7BRA8_9MICO|nr:LysM peptidoglycan-binding domain-containing protein [Microbacterium marinilacus]MBY0689827.1 LysM peptidoglycan-binding domain-containing protein [Microbacterium marinilacus]
MSTMSITAYEAHSVRPAATRLRLTRRGRRVLATLAAAPVAFGLGLAIMSGGSALASREDGAPAGTFDTVTVMPGGTLWAIAEDVAPTADPRDVVDAIIALNQLSGSSVDAGQQIAIPAEYSAG